MYTIKDVAKSAGVSIATVSHVINKTRYVSEETTNLVLTAMKKMKYQPNHIAKSLKTSKSNIVAFVIPDIANPYFSEVCRGFQDTAAQNEFIVVVFNSDRELSQEESILDVIRQYRINGIILNPVNIALKDLIEIKKLGVIVVLLGNQIETDEFDIVMVDNVKASYDATSYLNSLGHKEIALVNGVLSSSSGSQRLQGYRKAIQDNNLQFDETLVGSGSFEFESGYQQTMKLLTRDPRPSAIFATNDVLALGVLSAALDQGLKVPEHLSIMGFDNIPETERSRPKITTVDQPKYETGCKAGEIIFNKLLNENKTKEIKRVVLEHKVVIRESTRIWTK